MKSMFLAVLIILSVLLTSQVYAASSATEAWEAIGSEIDVVTISWTAHTDGSFTSYAIHSSPYYLGTRVKGCLFYVITNPGSVAPTDDYDITLLNSDGIDIAGGQLANRDTATSEDVKLTTARCVNGPLTVTISNNIVASATGTIILFFGGGR